MQTTVRPTTRASGFVGSAGTSATRAVAEKSSRRGLLAYWFVPTRQTRPVRVVLAEGGYFGVTLMIGGMAVLLGLYWQQVTDVVGAVILSGLAITSVGAGLAVAGGPGNLATLRAERRLARSHVTGALFALSSASAFGAVAIMADDHAWLVAALIGFLVAVTGYVLLPTNSGLMAITGLGVVLAVSTMDEVTPPTPLSVGAALLAVGMLLGLLSVAGYLKQRDLGLSLGAVIALVGAQQPLARLETVGWACGLSFAVGLACLALYRKLPAAVLLVVGLVAIAAAVLETTWHLTGGPLRVAATLAATGVTLLVTSGVGLYLWRVRTGLVTKKNG